MGVPSVLQALDVLYRHQGRRREWRRLLDKYVSESLADDEALPAEDQEESWLILVQFLVRLAREERQWDEAERLARLKLDVERRRAQREKEPIRERNLANGLHELAEIQRERRDKLA